jgi:hypothetical protein
VGTQSKRSLAAENDLVLSLSHIAFGHYCRTVNRWQRPFVSLVLSTMVWTFVGPVAMGVAGTVTPACCRRNGKHHCASGMSGTAGISTDYRLGFRASSSVCPYRSQIGTPTGAAEAHSYSVCTQPPPYAGFAAAVNCLFFPLTLVQLQFAAWPARLLALAQSAEFLLAYIGSKRNLQP